MDVNNVSNSTYASKTTYSYQKPDTTTAAKEDTSSKKTDKKEEAGAVYEKGNKADRSAIIAQLKADAENRTNQMRTMVESMMKNQGQQIGNADSMWRFLAGGKFTVTAQAKAQAQAAISEDGY